MPVIALTYHDVVPVAERAASGFTGSGAEHYKLAPEQFAQHLETIAAAGLTPSRLCTGESPGEVQVALTFDDGGASAASAIAPMLAARGWPGHFFITTGRIGTPGFVTAAQVRALRDAGHVVGSHSHTHPVMTRLSDAEIAAEWERSRAILKAILGEPVEVLSVPAGFYSVRVGRWAVEAGYRALFTSEPWLSPRRLREARVYGRFSITAFTPARHIAALCRLSRAVIWKEAASWQLRKAAKTVAGPVYAAVRRTVLERSGK